MSASPSGKQIQAARALAGWERTDLARVTGLNPATLRYIETEKNSPKKETLIKIISAFRNIGIEFIDNDGVRRLPIGMEVFEGRDRFQEFLNFVYFYLESFGGEVIVSLVDEGAFQRSIKNIEGYRSKMLAFVGSGKVTGRILAAEGNFSQTWAVIRRQTKQHNMPQVSFFAFGDNLALISFDHKTPPYVVLHKSGPFAIAYKNAFDAAWEKAEVV